MTSFPKWPAWCLALTLPLLFGGCRQTKTADAPNILWILLEDTSPLLGAYGTTMISTPHIDSLATKGILFQNAFMPAPVCSPCRSSMITGMMSTTLGTHNHHSARTTESAIYLPSNIKTVPEVFRAAGYFTFNNGKDDYNFTYDRKDLYSQAYHRHPLYGKRGVPIAISSLAEQEPFFGQIQLSGGKEIFSSTFKDKVVTPVDRKKIKLPPYLPAHPVIVEEYANHLDAIQITDRKVGDILGELEEHGILDNTIIFFFSDHGMRLTRHKQFLYDGGLHVPLIIADFRQQAALPAGTQRDELVSGLDLGPTSLALAGIPVPSYMEGLNIFDDAGPAREFVVSARDRCDFTIDRIRSVRSKDFKYIRNFMTDRPYLQPTYMDVDSVPFVRVMKQLYAEGKLDPVQSRFLADQRPSEELYDLREDPYELNNLASDPTHQAVRAEYADILDQWISDTDDKGQYPEHQEGLKLMLGIWGDHAVNPEYEALRNQYPDLAGSQFALKMASWEKVN